MSYKIINDDCFKALDELEENSVDCIVTDPPYGLTSITKRFGKTGSAPAQHGKDGSFARLSKGFMGKEWDGSGIEYNVEMWEKCLKVLKPGGYLLAFGGSRTYHRIACAIEDAGFEIKDMINYIYGSGFPKALDIGLAIDKKKGVKTKVFNGKSNESSKDIKDVESRFTTKLRNIHPTVKPTSLMQYLVRLVAPKGATILDPFMGSGSTGKAVMYENKERNANYKFIGIEKESEYCEIAEARIKFAESGDDTN